MVGVSKGSNVDEICDICFVGLFLVSRNMSTVKPEVDLSGVNVEGNANSTGRDMLVVLLWIGAWGTIDIVIEWFSHNKQTQLLLYICLFIAGFISLLFVDQNQSAKSKGNSSH